MKRFRFIFGSTLLCFMLAACVTMQPVGENTAAEEIDREIEPGDQVRLVTKNGERHEFVFSSISGEYIFGQEEKFKLEEIETLEVKKPTAVGYVAAHASLAAYTSAQSFLLLPLAYLIAVILLPVVL